MFSGSSRDVSCAGFDSGLAKKPSRHVSIQIPVVDEVVCPTRSQRTNPPASLSHAHSANAVFNSSQRISPTAADGRRLSLPGESASFQLKKSKRTFRSTPRLEKQHRKSLAVCDSRSSYKSNSSAVDLADHTVLSKKTSITTFSDSDINRTLASEVKSGKMSKDLAKLVIDLSKKGPQVLPLPKRNASELRSWLLAADSGCLKLPLSVQNHLIYAVRVNDSECSTAKKSRSLKVSNSSSNRNVKATPQFCGVSDNDGCISNVSVGKKKLTSKLPHAKDKGFQRDFCCSASGKPLGKSGRSKLKYHPASSRQGSILTNKSRQQEFTDDSDDIRQCATRKRAKSLFSSHGSVARSVVSSEDDTNVQPEISRRKAADKTVSKHRSRQTSSTHKRSLSGNHQQSSDSNEYGNRVLISVSSLNAASSPSFDDEVQSLVNEIDRSLGIRRMLQNPSSLNTKKSPTARYSTSASRRKSNEKRFPANTDTKQHKRQHSAILSTTEDNTLTNSDILKLLGSENFSVRSHLQNIAAQKQARSNLRDSVQDQNSSVTRNSSQSSLASQGYITRRHLSSDKTTFSKSSTDGHSYRSARKQDSATFGVSRLSDTCTSSLSAHRSLGLMSSKTQENLTRGKVSKGSNNITSLGSKTDTKSISQNNKATPAAIPSNISDEKVGTSSKENNQSCKLRSPLAACGSKLSGRWSDVGRWNGRVYTVRSVTSSSKMQTPKSVNVKQHKKRTQIPLKTVGSDTNNKTGNEQFCQHASDKSSVETVVSRVTSRSSFNTDCHATSSFSSHDKPSPHFKVHSTEDRSDSKKVLLLKRRAHVKKPSVTNRRTPTCSTSSEKEASKKQTIDIPASVSSCRDYQKTVLRASSEAPSLRLVVGEIAVSSVERENCGTAKKRSRKPDARQPPVSRLSDTESTVFSPTFDSRHFGVPPKAWMGTWSLSAAVTGSRSSLDATSDEEEHRRSADAGTVRSDDLRSCRLSTAASFDKAVSTDSEPELSTVFQTELGETDGEESDDRRNSQPAESADVKSPRRSADISNASQRFKHSFIAGTVSDTDLEDIQLEPFPSCLFSMSSMDVAADVVSDDENVAEDECAASLDPRTASAVNTGLTSAENKVKTTTGVNRNAVECAEDKQVLRQQCKITEPGCVDSVTDSGNQLNNNVNNLAHASSGSRPSSSSDVRESKSSDRSDIVQVFSSRSLAGKIHSSVSSNSSNGNSGTSLYRSDVDQRCQQSLAACAGSPLGTAVPDDKNEKLQQSNLQRNANSHDIMSVQSLGSDSSSKSDVKRATDASVVRSDSVHKRMAKLNSRQWAPEFKNDRGIFAIKTTLVPVRCCPIKQKVDSQGNLAVAGRQTLKSSQSDTSHEASSNNPTSSIFKSLITKAKDNVSDHQKPSGNRQDTDTSQSVLSTDSNTSSNDYKSLKAAVRNAVSNSCDHSEKPVAENVEQMVSSCSVSDARRSKIASNTSCQSFKEQVRNTNRSSKNERSSFLSHVELPDSGEVNMSTSSSRVSEPDTSDVGSLDDDSTDLCETSSSDKVVPEIDVGNLAACDPPCSSDDTCTQSECASVTSVNYDNPERASLSSDRSEGRADLTTGCDRDRPAAGSREHVDERKFGADICFDEILNARSCGFNDEERSVQDTGLCQSVAEFPARSRKFLPAADVFARRSLPAFCREEDRFASLISAGRCRNVSSARGAAGAEKNARKNSRDARVSSHDGERNESGDDLSADRTYPCDVTARSTQNSLTPKVKVNCKSSYRMKLGRRWRRDLTAVRTTRETGSSSATDVDGSCRPNISQRHELDALLRTMNVKRVSCSQLYRMSRAVSRTSDNHVCHAYASSTDAGPWTNFHVLNSGNKRFDSIEVVGEERGGDVGGTQVTSPSKNAGSNNQTNAPPDVRTTDETFPKGRAVDNRQDIFATSPQETDSADVVATQVTKDSVDNVSSCGLLLSQKRTISGVSGAEYHYALEDLVGSTELIKSDAKTKLAQDQETWAENSNRRRPPSASPTSPQYEYTDDTASSPSTSFSLSTTEALSDDFFEVLSSRLLAAIAKQQHQDQSAVGFGASFAAAKSTAAAGAATSQSECLQSAAVNSWSMGAQRNRRGGPFDCSDHVPQSYEAGDRRAPGVEGYLQRTTQPADAVEAVPQLRTTGYGYEVPLIIYYYQN